MNRLPWIAAAKLPFGPASAMWNVNRERIVLLAGPAAAVLQVAHPVVARGVKFHSNFQSDPTGRLTRTLDAVYRIAFGDLEDIGRIRQQVARAHAPVQGSNYSAADPEARLWVLATLIMGSASMFERFVRPMTPPEREALLSDNRLFGEVFGVRPGDLPQSWPAFEEYWRGMIHGSLLGSDPVCAEVAGAVLAPGRPWYFQHLSPVLRALTREFLPPCLADKLKISPPRIQPPLWKLLDLTLPAFLPVLPPKLRFTPYYLAALKVR